MFQCRSDSPQVKRNVISNIVNLLQELPHRKYCLLPHKEILGTSQTWLEMQPTLHSHFQKLNFHNSSQRIRKRRYQTFTGFLYCVSNILSRIVGSKKKYLIKIKQFWWCGLPRRESNPIYNLYCNYNETSIKPLYYHSGHLSIVDTFWGEQTELQWSSG